LNFGVDGGSLFAAGKPLSTANYLIRHRGMLTSPAGEAYGFVRSHPELALPDLELIFAPGPFLDQGLDQPQRHGVAFRPILQKPPTRGVLSLPAADRKDKPILGPRSLSDPGGFDRAAMLEGLRICAKIADAPALAGLLGPITRPIGATDMS